MKLFEFFGKEVKDKLPFDVVEDVHFHMIDDDAFYRKHYMPCMDKVKNETDNNVVRDTIMPMIDKCLNHYCNKYDLNETPKDLMSEQEKAQLVDRIMEYEKNPPKETDNAPTPGI